MSLLAVGAQDQYISISPEMSYWRQVVKRHTNFSMESISQTFLSAPTLSSGTRSSFTCRVGRHGDLLSQVYLSLEMPDIYSDDRLRFRWVANLPQMLLYSYSVVVDTQTIDQRWGEFMDIWNELTNTIDKQYSLDRMSGNTEDFISPKAFEKKVVVRNNNVSYSFYPKATPTRPSIKGRRIYIPLDFWFTKSPVLALPLVALQYQNVDITIELRPVDELYQVFDYARGEYVSPSTYLNRYPGEDVTMSRFTAYGGGGPATVNLNGYIDANFVFLDTIERNFIATSNPDFLVERVYRNEIGMVNGQSVADVIIANPVKEIVWVMRLADANVYNDWSNYTSSRPQMPGYGPMDSGKIMWNGMDRFELKPAAYFNLLQPYQHHTTSPREGIYCYSFAIHPEKIQPSGSFNASMINKVQILATLTDNNTKYNMYVYSVYYNIFRVISGSGQMVFAS